MIRGAILAAVLLALTPAAAHAASICSMSATSVAFGAFFGVTTRSSGMITISCFGFGNANYTLTLSTGSSGSYLQRHMVNGAQHLLYNLYNDPADTKVLGDGSGSTAVISGVISKAGQMLVTVYGRIPTQTVPAAGAYSDTIVATLRCLDSSCNTSSTSFLVTAFGQADCTISATDLNFGRYTQAQLDGQSQISLTCSTGVVWNVGLNPGLSPGATVTTRRMRVFGLGLSSLSYSLYRDAARTLNWGDTVGSDTVSGTSFGSGQTITVYGRIPASQPVPVGVYRDTIVTTITF
jgi:spore coat protein U-like protein